MGIWQSVAINSQKDITLFDTIPLLCSASEFLVLDKKGGKLGLLSAPNPASFLYPLQSFQQTTIAVDGRIYNKQKLCQTLNLDEDADIGSVIIELYKMYGPDGMYNLEGAFSLILYDRQKQMTLLYRSFLTGYPLYYVVKNNLLSVSTNPVDLLRRPDVSDGLDMEQMSANFALDLTGWNDTVFSDLNEVEHGEMVMISSEGTRSKKRSLGEVLIPVKYESESEIIETYRHLVESALEKNILPTTQYGIMLSSGMDSSTLAVLAVQELKKHGTELRAYSWSLPSYQKADESKKIQELCAELGIDLTLFDAEKFDPFGTLDNIILQPDLPFSNLYGAMISELYRKASEDGVNVLFNGHYGDNLFPSTRNLFVDILQERRYELFVPTFKTVIAQVGYKNALKSPAIRGLLRYILPFIGSRKPVFHPPEWLSAEAKESRRVAWENKKQDSEQGYEQFSSALAKRSTSSGIGRYFAGLYRIERLEPYTDIELLNYTLRLPAHIAYREGQMKYFAREAMRGLLPESIRTQPRVGLLNQFARDSFVRNSHKVRDRLFDDPSAWKVYVDEKWMEKKFKDISQVSDKDLLIIWMSLNIGPWQKAIKSGGALYEGYFMQPNSKAMK